MTTGQHGGYRKPERPAAVSTPQSGARTDGGPADKQAMNVASGGGYGARKAAEEQQQGAPMAAGGPGLPAQSAGLGAAAGGAPGESMFRPSEVPGQSIGAGVPGGAGQMMKEDPRMLLRELYKKFPTAAIAALLKHSGANG